MPKRIDELAAEEKKPRLSDEEWDKIHGKRQDMLHEWERGYGEDDEADPDEKYKKYGFAPYNSSEFPSLGNFIKYADDNWERGHVPTAEDRAKMEDEMLGHPIKDSEWNEFLETLKNRGDVWDLYDDWAKSSSMEDGKPVSVAKQGASARRLLGALEKLLNPEQMRKFNELWNDGGKDEGDLVDYLYPIVGGRGPRGEDEPEILEWLESQGFGSDSDVAKGLNPYERAFIRKLLKGKK